MVSVALEVIGIIGGIIGVVFITIFGVLLYRLHKLRQQNRKLEQQELTKNLLEEEEQKVHEEEINELVKVNPLHGIRTSVLQKKKVEDAFDDLDLSGYEKPSIQNESVLKKKREDLLPANIYLRKSNTVKIKIEDDEKQICEDTETETIAKENDVKQTVKKDDLEESSNELDTEDLYKEPKLDTKLENEGEGEAAEGFNGYELIEEILKKLYSDEYEQYLVKFKEDMINDKKMFEDTKFRKMYPEEDGFWREIMPQKAARFDFFRFAKEHGTHDDN